MASMKVGSPGLRQLLGTLLVAWTLVTGCAVVFASALYYRTGDMKIIIAYLGAPFLVGSALLLMIGLSAVSLKMETPPDGEPPTEMRRRTTIHGHKR